MLHAASLRSPCRARADRRDQRLGGAGARRRHRRLHRRGPARGRRAVRDDDGAAGGADALAARPPAREVRHVGEPVAVVVARSRYVAEDAAERIEVEWEPLPAVVDAGSGAGAGRAGPRRGARRQQRRSHLGSDRRRRRRLRPRRPRLLEALPPRPVRCGAARDARRCGVIRACKLRADALDLDPVPAPTHAPPLGIPRAGCGLSPCRRRRLRRQSDGVRRGRGHSGGRPARRSAGWRIEDRYENLVASIHAKEVVCYVDIACSATGEFSPSAAAMSATAAPAHAIRTSSSTRSTRRCCSPTCTASGTSPTTSTRR